MTMTGLFVNHGIRITAGIALLLAVMLSPVRPSKPFGSHTLPNSLPSKFPLTKTGTDNGDVASSRSSLTKASGEDELEADLEDELHATSQPSSAMFDVLQSLCSQTHRELIGCAVERAARPLRC